MNQLKQYALSRIEEFSLQKPSSYDASLYSKIKSVKDIEYHIKYAENIISDSENIENAINLPDYNERALAIYNAYVGIKKTAVCMSDKSILHNEFNAITREQFDCWCDKLHDLLRRNGIQNSRYISRPDG